MQRINYIEQILHSSVKVPKDILVINDKHLQTKVERTSTDLHELVGLGFQLVRIMDSVAPSANASTDGEKDSRASQYYSIPPTKMANKGNGISQTTDDDTLKQIMPLMEEGGSTHIDKLGLDPPPQLSVFELPPAKKKKKRRVEVMHEVFVKENIIVDGM
ncbi:hypothetical protein Tco_0366403 [Tanacetum coccineum]